MKKIASITRLFLAAAVSFTMTALVTSCGDDDDEPGDFVKITNRTSNQLMYSYASQSVDEALVISTGGAWQATVTKGDDWLSLRGATSGASKGQYSLGVDLTMNYSDEQRTGEIVITSGTASQTVYVIQDYNPSANGTAELNYAKQSLTYMLTASCTSVTTPKFTFGGPSTVYGYSVNGEGHVRKIHFYAKNANNTHSLYFDVQDQSLGIASVLKLSGDVRDPSDVTFPEATISCDETLLPNEKIYITFELFGKVY
jgi:hypothetical protein